MPANRVVETAYIGPFATIDDVNSLTLYKPDELGIRVHMTNEKAYQLVQLDSGATTSTSAGVVAAGQLAYWKDKATYLVTNDIAQAIGGPPAGGANNEHRNEVAGVFTNAVTAGYYTYIQQYGRRNVKAAAGGTYTVGNWAVANTGTAADCTTVNAGTAPGVTPIGLVAGARSAPNAPIDLTIALPHVP